MSIPASTLKDSHSLPTKEYQPFGCPTPYAEPLWYSRNISPHYNDSHRKLRAAIRTYVDDEILPYAFEWESAGKVPDKARETRLSSNRYLTGVGFQKTCRARLRRFDHWFEKHTAAWGYTV
jgi:hypothetical protein